MTSWWAQWRLKSPTSRLFAQPFSRAQIKENIKAQRHWLSKGHSPVNSPHKGPVTRKMFPFDDVFMFSKWRIAHDVESQAARWCLKSIVYSTLCSGACQRKYQSSSSLTSVRGNHRWPVNSPHKGPVTRKMIIFDDAIMSYSKIALGSLSLDLSSSSLSL